MRRWCCCLKAVNCRYLQSILNLILSHKEELVGDIEVTRIAFVILRGKVAHSKTTGWVKVSAAGRLLSGSLCSLTHGPTQGSLGGGCRGEQDVVRRPQGGRHGFQLLVGEANQVARNVFYIDSLALALLSGIDMPQAKWPLCDRPRDPWFGGSVSWEPQSLCYVAQTLLDSCICS